MLERLNGIVEDLGAVLGYSATAALVDWFGGGNLYVPQTADPGHAICKIIGLQAFARLVKEWGGEEVWLPLGYQREQDRRDRMIAVLLEMGLGSKQVASIAGMSERHVQHIRFRLEEMGVLPMIFARAGLVKTGCQNSGLNRVAKAGFEPGLQNRALKPAVQPGLQAIVKSLGRQAKKRKKAR